MSVTIAILIAALAAAGIILVLAYITTSKIKEKLREKYSDYFKAVIKKRYTTMGVDVVDVEIKDLFGNTIDEESYASLDGISSELYSGRTIYKN